MRPVLSQTGADRPPGTLQAVMFDMDGLLVDTEPLWFEVESSVMARLGGQWTPADQGALIGGSMDRSVAYLIDRAGQPAEPDQVANWLRYGMAELLDSRGVEPMPGAVELVGQVRASGVPYALVTSSEPIIVDAVLAALARRAVRFEVIVSGADVTEPKPAPEPYLLAAAKLGVDPQCCVALEDSQNGVKSARAAGCVTVAVPGHAPIADVAGVHVVTSLADLDIGQLRGLVSAAAPG